MIPFLLHARAAAGSPPPGTTLITPPTYDGYWNRALRYSESGPASSISSFIVRSDGSWEFTRSPGTPASGFWTTAPAAGVGAGFEILFTVLGGEGVPATLTNQAPVWTSLSSSRTVQITLSRSTFGAGGVSRDIRVEIRPIGGTGVTGEIILEAYVEIG